MHFLLHKLSMPGLPNDTESKNENDNISRLAASLAPFADVRLESVLRALCFCRWERFETRKLECRDLESNGPSAV
jgi:hypothetical protein